MLVAKINRVDSRADYTGPGPSWVMDLRDNRTPQRRPMNLRISCSWDGLHAIHEAIGLVLSRQTDTATGQEKTGMHDFTEVKKIP